MTAADRLIFQPVGGAYIAPAPHCRDCGRLIARWGMVGLCGPCRAEQNGWRWAPGDPSQIRRERRKSWLAGARKRD